MVFMSPEDGLKIAEAWYSWLDRILQSGLTDDYGFALASFVIRVTTNRPDLRYSLLAKILSHENTAFVFVSIADCIDDWKILTYREHTLIMQVLTGSRQDKRWLQAAALTRYITPIEIKYRIIGVLMGNDAQPQEIIRLYPPTLLNDCLHVFCGRPHPLWLIGTHHCREGHWESVLSTIARMPDHPCFPLALTEMFRRVLHSGNDTIWNDGREIWSELCSNATLTQRTMLFELLYLYSIAAVNQNIVFFWKEIYASIENEGERKVLVKEIVENIEAFDLYTWKCSIIDFFGKDELLEAIFDLLRFDRAIIDITSELKRCDIFDNEAITDTYSRFFGDIFSYFRPRLQITHDIVLSWIETDKLRSHDDLKSKIRQSREELYKVAKTKWDAVWKKRVEIDGLLEDWNDYNNKE